MNNSDFGYYLGKIGGNTVTLRFMHYSGIEKRWKSNEVSVVQYTVE